MMSTILSGEGTENSETLQEREQQQQQQQQRELERQQQQDRQLQVLAGSRIPRIANWRCF